MSYKNNKIIGSNNPSIRIYLNKKKESHLKSGQISCLNVSNNGVTWEHDR